MVKIRIRRRRGGAGAAAGIDLSVVIGRCLTEIRVLSLIIRLLLLLNVLVVIPSWDLRVPAALSVVLMLLVTRLVRAVSRLGADIGDAPSVRARVERA